MACHTFFTCHTFHILGGDEEYILKEGMRIEEEEEGRTVEREERNLKRKGRGKEKRR